MISHPNEMRVTAAGLYPPVEVSAPNSLYAKLLTGALASKESEMTAVTSYLYQHWYLSAHCREISELFRRIAQVEMHHLEMIGTLISKLGGNPQFRQCKHPKCCDPASCGCAYWNGAMIEYNTNVKQILTANISGEKQAVKEYKKLIEQIHDPCVQAVLKRIIEDEKLHISIFESLLTQCR